MKRFRLGQEVTTPDGIGTYQYRIMIKGLIMHMVSFNPGTEVKEPYASDTIWVLKTYNDEDLTEKGE